VTTDVITPVDQVQQPGQFQFASKDEIKREQAIVAWVNQQFQTIKTARTLTEQSWYLNLAFYYGRQNVILYNQVSGQQGAATRLFIPRAPYYRIRQVINKIRPTVRTDLAKLTSQKPNVTVIPASADDKDWNAAQAGEQIWDSVQRELHFSAVLRRALFWSEITGNSFIKSYWDPTAIDYNSDQMGYFGFCHETPFHVFVPDLREEDLEYQPFLIHAQARSPEYVQMKFGDRLRRPLNPNVSAATDLLDDSFINLIGIQQLDRYKAILVLECWVKPGCHPWFPQGAMFTVVGDQIVQGGEGWPYNHKKYPFAHIGFIPSGKFYRDSVITDLVPVQREINRTHSQIIEAKNRMAKPQLVGQKGSVDPKMITSEPGLFIEYNPGFQKPEPLPLVPLPAYVADELERLYGDFSDISGQHEITQGQVPPGVTSGTAISYLQEQDEAKLSDHVTSMENAIEKVSHLVLSYVGQYWDADRIVKVTGVDESFDALVFKGADLRGNTDVKVEAGSSLPTSKAAKQAFLLDLMKMGFIDPDKGLELMEIGGINRLYEDIRVDTRQAQRENLKMAALTPDDFMQYNQIQMMKAQGISPEMGMPGAQQPDSALMGMPPQTEPGMGGLNGGGMPGIEPMPNPYAQQQAPSNELIDPQTGKPVEPPLIIPVNTWDNHQVHIAIHNNYRKSQSFEVLGEENRTLFENHVQGHKDAMLVELQEMQMQAEAAGIQPGQEQPSSNGQTAPSAQPGLPTG
jgi:hypothetical protein